MKPKDWLFIALMGLGYAALSTLAFAPFHYPLLAWIALCPLFAAAVKYRNSVKSLLLVGFVSAAFLSILAFHWILPSVEKIAGGNRWLGGGVFSLFVLASSIREVIFVLLVGLLARETWQKHLPFNWVSVACVGVLVDGLVPKIIPVTWGNLIADNAYLVQIVEYTGVLGLTFLLVAVNFRIYRGASAIREAHRSNRPLLPSLATIDNLSLVVLSGALLLGAVRLNDVRVEQAKLPTVRIAAVQPDSPLVNSRNVQESRDAVYTMVGDTIPGLIRAAGRAAEHELDVIVLPEAAIPFASTNPNALTLKWRLYAPPVIDMINAMATEQGASIFLNEPAIVQGTGRPWQSNGVPLNTAVLVSPDGGRGDVYEKNILFPVGEIVPFAKALDALHLLERLPSDALAAQYLPGTKQELISHDLPKNDLVRGRFLPLICFEAIFPEYARSFFRASELNPDYIVNITQDGWFDGTIAVSQHFELVRIRAVETRRALVRAANTGLSALIGLDGQLVAPVSGPLLAQGRPMGYQVWDVPVQRAPATFYVRHGDRLMLWIAASLLLLSMAIRAGSRRRARA